MDFYELGPVPAPKKTSAATLEELKAHPERYFEGADIVMMLMSSALVFLMIQGIALVYAGAADRHSAITMARLPLITTAFVGAQWYLWGYTLAFSPSSSSSVNGTFTWYGGDTTANAFVDLLVHPVGGSAAGPKIPEVVYALYQGMFASFTASIISGSAIRKAKVGRFLVFISIWLVVVYCPIARWTWHHQGWSRLYGVMDFAGGTAVHICSGATVAAHCVFSQLEVRGWKLKNLRNRRWRRALKQKLQEQIVQTHSDKPKTEGPQKEQKEQPLEQPPQTDDSGVAITAPTNREHDTERKRERNLKLEMDHLHYSDNHSVTNIILGTTLLWFGWFGFNGGSAQGANLRAASAVLATHVAACTGGSVGLLLEWFMVLPSKVLRKDTSKAPPSVLGFCDGAISGLVAITPAAGFVPIKVASAFGVIAALFCKFLRFYVRKRVLPYDILDICAVHAGGGFVGMLLTAAFADDVVTGLDGYSRLAKRTGGQRLGYQLLDVTAGFGYSFFASLAILVILNVLLKLLRLVVNAVRSKLHKELYRRDKEYRSRYDNGPKDDVDTKSDQNRPRTPVVKDKLVALDQHEWLKRYEERCQTLAEPSRAVVGKSAI